MIKTLVSFDKKQKAWLDSVAKEKGVPMAYLVREAVTEYMSHADPAKKKQALRDLINASAGSWKGMDGLKYQLKMRDEWR